MVLTIIAAAFVLSILIITHELGHYAAARSVGVRVLRFSLGLGPRIAGFKKGDTDYAVSMVPFGGYVKLAGTEDTQSEGKDDEFASKSTPAKIWILLSGPLANLVLAFFLYLMIASAIGTSVLEATRVGYVEPGSAAFDAGIQEGDEILMVGDKAVSNWNEIAEEVARQTEGAGVKVKRDGDELWLVMEPQKETGITPLIDPIVGRVQKGSPAEKVGLEEGDRILAVGNRKVERWEDLIETIQSSPDSSLEIVWVRDARVESAAVVPKSQLSLETGEAQRIGVIGISMNVTRVRLPFFSAARVSSDTVLWVGQQIFGFLGKLITGRASVKMLGGGLFIAKMAGETARWGLDSLLNFMAFLSINLFIINLFPIPMLDGGNVVYHLTEAIRGKPLSLRQKTITQQIGLVILIVIIAFVLLMDIMRLAQ
jgi:regulator of sigma E protease